MTRLAPLAACLCLLAVPSCALPAADAPAAFVPGQKVSYTLEVTMDGQRVATPSVTVLHGESAEIAMGEDAATLSATIHEDGRVSLHVPVREEDGWVAAPRVVMRANETADLHFQGRAEKHHLRVVCRARAL